MGLSWTPPDFWDLWKAVSIGLTGLFGVMGLLTTYKDKDTGRITVWGKINLAGIILSATMGVLAQLVDIQRKTQSAAKSAAEAAASAKLASETAVQSTTAAENTEELLADLLDVSRRTQAIARGTDRTVASSEAAARAGERAASTTLGIARDTSTTVTTSRAALGRVERLLSPFDAYEAKIVLFPFCMIAAPANCMETIRSQIGNISFGISTADQTVKPSRSDLIYTGKPRLEAGSPYLIDVVYPLNTEMNSGNITSYLDLPGRTISVYLEGSGWKLGRLIVLTIRTRDGQSITIPMSATSPISRRSNSVAFQYTFPKDRDPRSIGRVPVSPPAPPAAKRAAPPPA